MPKLKVPQAAPTLARLDPQDTKHTFATPSKCINEGTDVSSFLTSCAYTDIMTFLLQLTTSMFPRKLPDGSVQTWELGTLTTSYSAHVSAARSIIAALDALVDQHPPDTGSRRYGNVAFRSWCAAVDSQADDLLERHISELGNFSERSGGKSSVTTELKAYLMGSWGSAQRLDYGTGHELSFLAFLGCLWKLGAFGGEGKSDGTEERAIVIGVLDPYLALVRRLIKTYTLEPAGSHGVWGLDDHSFLPYIFGSAQLSPAISDSLHIPTEGSLPDAPNPGDITKASVVEQLRHKNLYFGAVGFINDVKKGPFWEHSPVLYDVSGVSAGWAKINKGMIKMYNAEVLSKFPVVQHFPFGSLFRWETDPDARPPTTTPHAASHDRTRLPTQSSPSMLGTLPAAPSFASRPVNDRSSRGRGSQPATGASTMTPMAAPWVSSPAPEGSPAPAAGRGFAPPPSPMRAPWAK